MAIAKKTNAKTLHLTTQNFEKVALRPDATPVLVDFWAPWCGPCRAVGPILDELAQELDGKAIIAKVNIDEEPELADAARIRSIPTMLLLRQGRVEDVVVGLRSKQELKQMLTSV